MCMRNMQKREGRKAMGSLKKALSTAVLAAGLAVLPSCVTAPKAKMTLATKLLPSRHRGDAELQAAMEKLRSEKGTLGNEPVNPQIREAFLTTPTVLPKMPPKKKRK